MADRFRDLYNYLLESGELLERFPKFKGEWEKDKKAFIKEQRELEELANIQNIDDEEYNY